MLVLTGKKVEANKAVHSLLVKWDNICSALRQSLSMKVPVIKLSNAFPTNYLFIFYSASEIPYKLAPKHLEGRICISIISWLTGMLMTCFWEQSPGRPHQPSWCGWCSHFSSCSEVHSVSVSLLCLWKEVSLWGVYRIAEETALYLWYPTYGYLFLLWSCLWYSEKPTGQRLGQFHY